MAHVTIVGKYLFLRKVWRKQQLLFTLRSKSTKFIHRHLEEHYAEEEATSGRQICVVKYET